MTRNRRRRLLLVGLLLLGLGTATALALTAFKRNMLYFYQPSAVVAGKVPAGARFRIGGLVQRHSVTHGSNGLLVRFRVADCAASVPVRYKGILPDLFREGQGVIAYGRINKAGVFQANRILAKHGADYMPPAVAEELKNKHTGHPCMPVGDMQAKR